MSGKATVAMVVLSVQSKWRGVSVIIVRSMLRFSWTIVNMIVLVPGTELALPASNVLGDYDQSYDSRGVPGFSSSAFTCPDEGV